MSAYGDAYGSPYGGTGSPPEPFVNDLFLARMSTILRSLPSYVAKAAWFAAHIEEFRAAQARTRRERELITSHGVHMEKHGKGLGLQRGLVFYHLYKQSLVVRSIAVFMPRTTEFVRLILDTLSEGTVTEYRIREYVPLTYVIELVPIGLDEAVRWEGLLRTAKPYGVRMLTVASTQFDGGTFRFDSGPGFDQGHLATTIGG